MATVYSLVCWGGYTGKSVTGSNSGGYLLLTTSAAHGVRTGMGLASQFTATTLPGNISASTTYYLGYGTSTTTMYVYDTEANAIAGGTTGRVAYSSAGTSVVAKSAMVADPSTALAPYGLSDLNRWDAGGGSYRIYDGIVAWNTARTASSVETDNEVAELGDAFTEAVSTTLSITVNATTVDITSLLNGVRSPAFHGGVLGGGYIFRMNTSYDEYGLRLKAYRNEVEGFTIAFGGSSGAYALQTNIQSGARRMIIYNMADPTKGWGVQFSGNAAYVEDCLICNIGNGVEVQYNNASTQFNNNTITKCARGVYNSSDYSKGFWYDNIILGNTTEDWDTSNTGFEGASHNAGTTGSAWISAGGTRVEITESSPYSATFVDWTNNDFRPASGSQLIDTGRNYYGILSYDIADNEVPNYNNGGSEAVDVGAYEYDHGYGDHPRTQTVSIDGIIAGTRVKIAKQSDGTELYNDIPGTSYSDTYSQSASTPVYVYLRKGSVATYYHPLKLSGTIDPVNGLSLSASGLQQEDIAAHDYSATSVATDWTFNSGTGAIAHASGTTRYSVQDLYSWHQDYYDDSATVDDNPLMHGTTPTIFEIINSGTITSSDLEDLYGGSIEFGNGDLWSNLWTTDTMAAAHDIYIVQDGSKYTSFWSSGPIDVLLKVANTGTLVDSGLVTAYARPWGYTYAQYTADLSGGGRTVAPLLTSVDAAITETTGTVSGWTDITVSYNDPTGYSHDFGDVHGAQTYYCEVDCNNRPLSEVYQYLQYLTRDASSVTLNGVEGWQYQSAHTGYTAITAAPFGTYVGGIFTAAKGIWLLNVPSGDLLNYILTDDAGHTHQNVAALNQSVTVSGLVVGSQVQIYDVTNSTELVNQTASTSSVRWEDPSAPAGDRVIRLRVGMEGYLPINASIGTCGTSASTKDVTYLAAQSTDTVHTNNGLDGSAVTNISVDSASVTIQINDAAGAKTWSQIYAYVRYWQGTSTGIASAVFDCISATDTANYFLTGVDVRNTHANPLTLTGGWGRDSSSGTVAACIDSAGSTGNIFVEPDHVVAYQTSGSYAITGDISTVLSAVGGVPAATLAAAQVTPIHADMRKTNGTALQGDGTEADKFRSVLVP